MTANAADGEPVLSLHNRFAGLIESLPDALVVADAGGRILLANTLAERLFGYGYGEGQLAGAPLAHLVPPRLRDGMDGALPAVLPLPTISSALYAAAAGDARPRGSVT